VRTEFSKKAVKVIEKMDLPTKERIRKAVFALPDGDIKLLSGKIGVWRLRVGDWLVLFSYPDKNTVLIEKIAPRGQAYKEG